MKKKTQTNRIVRQGDVLVRRVKDRSIPENASLVPNDNGRVVLAYGEVTGHAHAIAGNTAALWREAGEMARTLLEVKTKTELKHEEHSKIPLEPGIYEVVRQREYSPEEIRFVAD